MYQRGQRPDEDVHVRGRYLRITEQQAAPAAVALHRELAQRLRGNALLARLLADGDVVELPVVNSQS